MMIWLLPLVPWGGAAAMLIIRRRALLPWLAVAPLVVVFTVALWAAAVQPVIDWSWWGPRFELQLAVNGLNRVLIVLIPVIALPVVAYASASSRSNPSDSRLLALLLVFTGAMELLAVAGDLLTLLIAWELVGACSWALIAFEWRDPARPRAALNAFITTRTGDLGLYLAAAASVAATGSVRFDALVNADRSALHVVAAGVLLAAAAKSAQLPFSPWLFSAMAGPTAASALLHSATMVAAGAFLLARLAPVLAPTGWFHPTVAWLGLATALAGGVVASLQSDLKKALAASTSAQYGLMFVAVGAGFTAAAGLHLVTHAAFKALLFLGAGVAVHAAGTGDLARHRLGTALPHVARLFAIGALALAAVPPLGGAYSKEQVLAAATQARFGGPWLISGLISAGFLSTLYAGRLYLLAFGPGPSAAVHQPTRLERWSLTFLAGVSVLLGLLWLPGAARWFEQITDQTLPTEAARLVLFSLITTTAAGGTCWLLWRRGILLDLGLPDKQRNFAAGWFGLPMLATRLVVTPALRLSIALAKFDDRVVDAGIRTATRTAALISRLAAWRAELMFERIGTTVADVTSVMAGTSRTADDRVIDRAVEWLARAFSRVADASSSADDERLDTVVEGVADDVGRAGRHSRRLQTGLAHDYYLILTIGSLGLIGVAAFWR
ncbi:MAG: NADH-quinone oxidoreductase subunit L [Cyanobacteria bacterium]|nr:NADH-quinone oxidoreductase subunit L [Cyanobacteriota bacterium]